MIEVNSVCVPKDERKIYHALETLAFFFSLSISSSPELWRMRENNVISISSNTYKNNSRKMNAQEAKTVQFFIVVFPVANFAQEIFHFTLTLLRLTNEIILKLWASHFGMVLSLMIRITSQRDATINLFSTVTHTYIHTWIYTLEAHQNATNEHWRSFIRSHCIWCYLNRCCAANSDPIP